MISRIGIRPGRCYRIAPLAALAENATMRLSLFRDDAAREEVFLPTYRGVGYVSAPAGQWCEMSSDEAEIAELGPFASALARLRHAAVRKDKYKFFLPGLALLMTGGRLPRRLLANSVRFLSENGLRPDSAPARAHPELFAGFSALPHVKAAPAPLKLAIALHLFYEDVWPDIEAALKRAPYAFDLFVTHAGPDESLDARIRAAFPGAHYTRTQNKGRDLYPFLTLLEQGAFDGYDLVCKVHGKRTINAPALTGALWRRKIFLDLIAAPGAMEAIAAAFAANPRLGLVGPKGFRKKRNPVAMDEWRAPEQSPQHIISSLGGNPAVIEEDFFAGAMFWVRPEALAALKSHRFSTQFHPETGGVYDALEVAFETAFIPIARLAGYHVGAVDCFEFPIGIDQN